VQNAPHCHIVLDTRVDVEIKFFVERNPGSVVPPIGIEDEFYWKKSVRFDWHFDLPNSKF